MFTMAALGLAATSLACATEGDVRPCCAIENPTSANSPHGFTQMIGDALSEMNLNAVQEAAVEALSVKVEPLQIQVDQAEAKLLLALAGQVKANSIDVRALDPVVAAYVTAREALAPALRGAVDELHAMLDADQRADFADALESVVHEVTLVALSDEKFNAFAAKLGLSDAQKEKIRAQIQALVPAIQTERRSLHEAIEAFRNESYSTEKFMPLSDVSQNARARAERIIHITGAIMAALDAPQRDKLAAAIEAAAQVRTEGTEEPASTPAPNADGAEDLGTANQSIWVAAGRRGFGRRGFVAVGRAPGYYYRRAVAYPVATGWGWGW